VTPCFFTEDWEVRAAEGCHFGHTLQIPSDLVVFLHEVRICFVILVEKPQSAYGTVSKLGNHSIEVAHCDLLDVVLHSVDLNLRGRLADGSSQDAGRQPFWARLQWG